MKILFVGQNLQTGGVQKSLVNMLKVISEDNDLNIDLFLFSDGDLLEDLPKNIRVMIGTRLLMLVSTPFSKVMQSKNIFNKSLRIILMLLVRIVGSKRLYTSLFKLQRKFCKYDIAISYFNDVPNNYFNQGTNKFVLEYVPADKKIAWVHTDPIEAKFNKEYCELIYRDFDYIICVSTACADKLRIFLPQYKNKIKVVYNLFPITIINNKSEESLPFTKNSIVNIVTVARIDNVTKRIDRIIEVCKKLNEEGINNFKWRIVGEGPDMKNNAIRVKEYGLDECLEFLGNKNNPYPYIKYSDLFVLASDFEGYPMVIGESLLLKTPIVSTKYAAAKEQINEGINGIITEKTTDDLFLKLKNLLLNTEYLEQLQSSINKESFTNDIAINQIYSILNQDSYEK